MKLLVLFFLLAAGSCLAELFKNNIYSSFYNSLPDDLKYPFIGYQLALVVVEQASRSKATPKLCLDNLDNLLTPEGLEVSEETFRLLQALNTPNGFSLYVYDVATELMGFTIDEIIGLIKNYLVCPHQDCYDLGDVGSSL